MTAEQFTYAALFAYARKFRNARLLTTLHRPRPSMRALGVGLAFASLFKR